jgi:hypothetical protein
MLDDDDGDEPSGVREVAIPAVALRGPFAGWG